MSYTGSCHCGQVAFDVEGEIDSLLECNCSICSRKGYLLWFVPGDKVTLTSGGDSLSFYTFNTHKIRHAFCPNCGCAPFGLGTDAEGRESAAVNARCLDGIEPSQFTINHYDGWSA